MNFTAFDSAEFYYYKLFILSSVPEGNLSGEHASERGNLMKQIRVLVLFAASALFAVASAAIANGASPLAGIANFSGFAGGAMVPKKPVTNITEPVDCSLLPPETYVCANGDRQDMSPTCVCTEYDGQMKSSIPAGEVKLDLITDSSGVPGSYIVVPSPGGPLTCNAVTGVGMMLHSLGLPGLFFTVGGYICPGEPTTFSGSYGVINPLLKTEGLPAKFPNATGSGSISGQITAAGGIIFTMNGKVKRK